MSATESEARDILTTVLSRWGTAVATGDTARVADLYTEAPVFQGLRPGPERDRAGVADYYAHQPIGLTPTITPIEVRALGENEILAFLAVDFAAPGRPVVATHLTVLLTRIEDEWLIEHYHVSVRPTLPS
ncbi:nuclear transport factor 2 family protein [Mycetocola sp. JXN-3]|uniref:YybH family protein n=1 Tax=Mycetocola sp. JXN-3 TaxID=2116510 RepID=UPI00165D207E|nr:nuclear transport factor 2 family protein [Mycetocola sp. JXN-3]